MKTILGFTISVLIAGGLARIALAAAIYRVIGEGHEL